MTTEDLIQTSLKVDGVAKRSLYYSDEFWAAPPLAPTGTLDAADIPVQQKARRPATREEQSFQPLEDNDFLDAQTSFGSHRTRIAGTAIVAVVGITTLVYFWASAGEKKATQSANPSAAMQSSLEAPAQTSSGMPEPTPEPSAGVAWPDSPPSITAEISPEIAPAAPTDNPSQKKATQSAKPSAAMQSSLEAPAQTSSGMPEPTPEPSAGVAWPDSPPSITAEISPEIAPAAPADNPSQRQTDSESQKQEFVFLQRPGVNIRSEPSTNGRVLGTARKGARLKVTIREGDWMRVESGRLKGWINSQFLAPNEPR